MKKLLLAVLIVGAVLLLKPAFILAEDSIGLERAAEAITKLLISGRGIIAEQQDLINTHDAKMGQKISEDLPKSFKGFVPAVYGRLTGKKFFKDTGIHLRQTTLGKGDIGPRNEYNVPDEWETTQLKKFEEPAYPKGLGYGEVLKRNEMKIYRYVYPIYIEKACLQCHGDPANSPTGDGKDISGRVMENYKLGELRGSISVTIPLE